MSALSEHELTVLSTFSPDEQELLVQKLGNLLQSEALKKAGVDNTSLPLEQVQSLWDSLVFTLRTALGSGYSRQLLLDADLADAIAYGRSVLKNKQSNCKIIWEELCRSLAPHQKDYLFDTLKNIGAFFERYNLYDAADAIPCSIDYWLLCPVSEEEKGVFYLEQYLRRLHVENAFLSAFDKNRVVLLYLLTVSDVQNAFFNLCEPVLLNAVSLELIGRDGQSLLPDASALEELQVLLCETEPEPLQTAVAEAAKHLCGRIGLADSSGYFVQASASFPLRLANAAASGHLAELLGADS